MAALKKQTVILIAFLLCLGAAFFIGSIQSASGDEDGPQLRGPFAISAGSSTILWRIDQKTGYVSYCVRENASVSSTVVKNSKPVCSEWGS